MVDRPKFPFDEVVFHARPDQTRIKYDSMIRKSKMFDAILSTSRIAKFRHLIKNKPNSFEFFLNSVTKIFEFRTTL